MFIDELNLYLKAGRGGNGVVRWLHLKGKEFSGPAGGNGGRGGDVVIKAVRDIGILSKYRNKDKMAAENGEHGKSKSQEGKNGENLVLELPIGSVVTNLKTGKKTELLEEGEEKTILKGGTGGLGNKHFKASTNVKPEESTPGKPGEDAEFLIELELVVDAGLVGLPNAGKSSLINALSNAKAKIGEYQFTTLEPNLGEVYGYIFADIPGLIEGAAEGKGLGHKFLRHVKRTKLIVHCVSIENENPQADYEVIRKELEDYSYELGQKEEVIVLTKNDTVSAEKAKEVEEEFKKKGKPVFQISILNDALIKDFSDSIIKILENK